MLLMFSRLQYFVDLIVAQSPSKNAKELTRLNHYVWICLFAWPVSILAISYNMYIKAFFLASLISAFYFFYFQPFLSSPIHVKPSSYTMLPI